MYVLPAPSCMTTIVETRLKVRIEIGGTNPSAEMKRGARYAIAVEGGLGREQRPELGGELRRDALVGIEREDPVVAREARGEVLLIDVSGPAAAFDPNALAARDRNGVVAAARIDDHDLVGPRGAVDGRGDVVGLVERDDRDGKRRHGAMVLEMSFAF